jgi:hypothetical protein
MGSCVGVMVELVLNKKRKSGCKTNQLLSVTFSMDRKNEDKYETSLHRSTYFNVVAIRNTAF